MTRLTEEWICAIKDNLTEWEKELESKTNLSALNLAALGAGVSRGRVKSASWRIKVAVVPITVGQGIIGTFAENVAAIINHFGFESFITEATDVAGFHEASQRGAAIVFFADDQCFLAVNINKGVVADNAEATARGYVAALEGAVEVLRDKEVLVLGGGRVGKAALSYLKLRGADPIVYDKDPDVVAALKEAGWRTLKEIDQLKDYPLIVDACPEGSWIHVDMLHPDALIAAPGVPLSLDEEAHEVFSDRLIHDLLPIGVVTMLAMAC